MTASRRFWVGTLRRDPFLGPARATNGQRVHVINYHHVNPRPARNRRPCGVRILPRQPVAPHEYAEAWKVLQRDLPRRDALPPEWSILLLHCP